MNIAGPSLFASEKSGDSGDGITIFVLRAGAAVGGVEGLCLLGVTAVAQAQTQATRDVFLPSGKLMRVLSVTRLNVAHQGTALVLTYQTDLSISNLSDLRKEIDEIWPVFKGDVEKARLTTAIISAKEVPQGVALKSGGAHYFMFRKVDGEWRLVGDTEKPADQAR